MYEFTFLVFVDIEKTISVLLKTWQEQQTQSLASNEKKAVVFANVPNVLLLVSIQRAFRISVKLKQQHNMAKRLIVSQY